MINTVHPPFKDGPYQDNAQLTGQIRQSLAGRPRYGFGQPENRGVFGLAEVQRGVELLQNNQIGPVCCGFPYQFFRGGEAGGLVRTAGLLNGCDGDPVVA